MSGLASVIEDVAPVLASALGGPLAGAAVGFLAKKLNLSDSTVEAVQNAVSGMKPEDLVKLKQMDYEFREAMAENGIKLQLAQIEVNKAEAQSANMFIAGGRPAMIWICAASFAWMYVLQPMCEFGLTAAGHPVKLPVLDMSEMMPVLLGLLGLGGMRTAEKMKGVVGLH